MLWFDFNWTIKQWHCGVTYFQTIWFHIPIRGFVCRLETRYLYSIGCQFLFRILVTKSFLRPFWDFGYSHFISVIRRLWSWPIDVPLIPHFLWRAVHVELGFGWGLGFGLENNCGIKGWAYWTGIVSTYCLTLVGWPIMVPQQQASNTPYLTRHNKQDANYNNLQSYQQWVPT